MNVTELTIRLLLLFFPGIIAALVITNLTTHKRPNFNLLILYSFILGLLSYFTTNSLLALNGLFLKFNGVQSRKELTFFKSLTDPTVLISMKEIMFVSLISIVLSLVISLVINRGWFHKIARAMKVTNQFGEKDVWQHLFNSPDIGWVTVRDLENNLMYQGYVGAFSDTFMENELLLKDVKVYYGETGEYLYDLKILYITRDIRKLTVEIQ